MDLEDAFHWGKMHPDSKKYVVICWKGRLWRWNGVCQGLKPASAYFSSMVTQLLNTALGGAGAGAAANDGTKKSYQGAGAAWSVGKWFLGWIDDYMPIANTRERCKHRQDILLDVLAVANLPLSPKCKYEISQQGKLIGLYWTVDGHCLDDAAVDSLQKTLLQRPSTKS